MRTNVKAKDGKKLVTFEGGRAVRTSDEKMLRRALMTCFLGENTFYEDGQSIKDRIRELVAKVDPQVVAAMAIEAREDMNLRHAPLWIAREMARNKYPGTANTIERVIQRADELGELLAMYWEDGKSPLSKQLKIGLARAFNKFDEYNLAKYNRDTVVKLKDVLFMVHAKPKDDEQAAIWKRLVEGTLKTPDTWEVNLSSGEGTKTDEDKKVKWERLLKENKLGGLALLRNLRNMKESKVNEDLVFAALDKANFDRVLPFRFIAAEKYVPHWAGKLEQALFKCVKDKEKMSGKTVVLVDISGSMDCSLSEKSDMQRDDAAIGLAICAQEMCEDCRVYAFHSNLFEVPVRRGFALRDAINKFGSGGTYLGGAIRKINENYKYDRIIVVTDEQAHDEVGSPLKDTRAYMINVAPYKNGVGYGEWIKINGFSESIFRYINAYEEEF